MSNENELYCSIKAKGLRLTAQIRSIINCLAINKKALNAEEIAKKVKEKGQRINLATVYRNLEKLEETGMIERVGVDSNRAYYRLLTESKHGHHFICLSCHKSFSIPFCPLRDGPKNSILPKDFQITGHHYEVYGYCGDCVFFK